MTSTDASKLLARLILFPHLDQPVPGHGALHVILLHERVNTGDLAGRARRWVEQGG